MGLERPPASVSYIDRTKKLYASQKPYQWAVHDRELRTDSLDSDHGRAFEQTDRARFIRRVHLAEQDPFHFRNDVSHREIPLDTPSDSLRVSHFGYDTSDAKKEAGCVLPLKAVSRLAEEGRIGSAVDRALSFMGGIYSQRMVRDEVAPRFLDFVASEEVDLVLLVPV